MRKVIKTNLDTFFSKATLGEEFTFAHTTVTFDQVQAAARANGFNVIQVNDTGLCRVVPYTVSPTPAPTPVSVTPGQLAVVGPKKLPSKKQLRRQAKDLQKVDAREDRHRAGNFR